MLLNRRGTFQAKAPNRGIDATGDNNLMTAIFGYQLLAEHIGGGNYNDISAEGLDITGYHYIETKDGSLNTFTVDALKSSFGWDGRDPFELQDDPKFGEVIVQIVCDFEEYKGKQAIKVKYINPRGYVAGGVTKADEANRKAMMARMGSKLRAAAGPAKNATPTAAAAPAPPQRPAPSASTAPSAPARKSTIQDAWAKFSAECPKNWDQSATEKEWFRILDILFPGVAEPSPEQWAIFEEKSKALINPF